MVSRKLYKYWFLTAVMLVMFYPAIGGLIDRKIELSGMTSEQKAAELNLHNILNGDYQSGLNTWWENNFPGRALLIKARGQFLYSLFDETPNNNVSIGKDKYLYEPMYITEEFGIYEPCGTEYFDALREKLETLNAIVEENHKEMYVFVTPNKAYFYPEQVSWQYNVLKKDTSQNYTVFLKMLDDTDLKYFDSRKYIEDCGRKGMTAPVFYPTGIHWSTSWGAKTAVAFEEYIKQNSKWDLNTLALGEKTVTDPIWPDADLYLSLNVIQKPKVQFYEPEIKVVTEKDTPNVFARGGSFMGQSISALIRAGVFGKNVHFENSYYFTDTYSKVEYLPAYDSYDEMDIKGLLGESDILILEVNEAAISHMSFGFIDYLLEHPDYVAYPEN